MGNFLAAPITEKDSDSGSGNGLKYGISAMQGWRTNMEDSHLAVVESADFPIGTSIFAVCDGHGGKLTAEVAAQEMVPMFANVMKKKQIFSSENTSPQEIGKCMRQAFLDLDEMIRDRPEMYEGTDQSGCTAIAAFITSTHIIVSNAGDSRSVLAKNGMTVPMSYDHKPMNDTERARIERAGGMVRGNRVNGDLAVSRALGDFTYKQSHELGPEQQQVSAEPDIKIEARDGTEEFLIIACDGIWDVMTNDDVCRHVRSLLSKGEKDCALIAEEILDECLTAGSRDNMSIVIVLFPGANVGTGDGVMGIRRDREEKEKQSQENEKQGESLVGV